MKNCYWQSERPDVAASGPKLDQYDYVILGGGYSGLSVARELKATDPSASVVVLEKDYVGFGASGRNGGFAMTLLGLNNAQLLRDKGLERSRIAHTWMKKSVWSVRDLVHEEGIDCEAVDQGFLTVALNSIQEKRVDHEVECYRKLGTDVRVMSKKDMQDYLPGSPVISTGLWDPNCVILHPYKLARGLKAVTERRGAEISEGTGVLSYERDPSGGYRITLSSGRVIRSKRIVVTVNGYAASLGMFKSGIVPIYTYIVATEPLSQDLWKKIGWAAKNGIESAFRLVHYMRPTRDGRILLGGKSAYYYFGQSTRPEYDEHEGLFAALRKDLVKFFPDLEGVRFTHAWGGPIGSTANFFPTVGYDARDPNLLWAMGCCGHGVALSNSIGKIVADLAYGRRTENTELFFVNKKPWPVFPPEPLRYLATGGYKNTLWMMDRVDEARTGKFF